MDRLHASASDTTPKRGLNTSTPSSGCEMGSTSITFNQLCSRCMEIFSDNRPQNPRISAFHSLEELEHSARFACHLCSQLMHSSKFNKNLARVRATLAVKSTRAALAGRPAPKTELEAQLFRHRRGLSLCLRSAAGSHRDMVADLSLFFVNTSDNSRHFPRSLNTNSEESWHQASRWVQHCSKTHSHCESQIAQSDERPTRLLDVGVAGTPFIKLHETSKLDSLGSKYTTLSHCWGDKMPTQLLRGNYSAFLDRIALDDLPKTFRDAIEVTRKLGLRFLWIDSLCIIQDSKSDWVKESGRMHMVYRNSNLTIAAGAASDANGGLYRPRNPVHMAPCYIEYEDESLSQPILSKYHTDEDEEDQTRSLILFTRAWVFQERLLSPRLLIFGKRELYWECLELKASEVYPNGIPSYDVEPVEERMLVLRRQWRQNPENSIHSLWSRWASLVDSYSGLQLSHISDKLVAVAGLAASHHESQQALEYLAGIWSYRLRRGLLWECNDGSLWRKPSYTAPSWSWASVDGKISTAKEPSFFDGLAEVLDAEISLSSLSNPYGMVNDGCIKLGAPLIYALLQRGKIGERWYIRVPVVEVAGDSPHDPGPEATNMFPVPSIEINVTLDDRATNYSLKAFAAYLMPVETILTSGENGLYLEGLVLLPTHQKRGQFRRIGYFYIRDHWYDRISTSDETELSSSTPAGEDDVPQDDQKHSETEEIYHPWITELDVMDFLEEQSLQPQPLQDNKISRGFKAWLNRNEQESARGHRKEDDPYCNGTVNRALYQRYGNIAAYLPNITSFLNYASIRINMDLNEGELDEMLYEEVHPEYMVFHIV